MVRKQLSGILLSFLFSFVISCKSDTGVAGSIVGKWIPAEVDNNYKTSYNLSNGDVKKLSGTSSMEFTKDGKFKSVMPHESINGVYYIKERQVTTILDDGRAIDYTIDLMSRTKLVLTCNWGRIFLKRQ